MRIRSDPQLLVGSGFWGLDPDTRLQNWHLINPFGIKNAKNNFKFIYVTFYVHKKVL
jgi:hypothetical protein